MKENQYELPEEFENVRVAHRLNPKKSSQSSDSKKTALDNRTTSNGSAAGSDSKSDVPLLQRQTSDGVSKSPSVPSFKKPMKTTASVPGNRVRGGKRVVSERVSCSMLKCANINELIVHSI